MTANEKKTEKHIWWMTGPLKQLFCSTVLLPSVYITCNHRHGQAPILESPGVPFCMNACESKGAIASAGLLTRATEVWVLGLWKGNKASCFSLVLKKSILALTFYIQ